MLNTENLSNLFLPLQKAWETHIECQDGQSRRIFHGRGHCFPGLEWCSIDYFDPIIFVTYYQDPPPEQEYYLRSWLSQQALQQKIEALVIQHRYKKGTPFDLVFGNLPDRLFARRGNLNFHLHLQQQNIGFFLDMEPGRCWLEQHGHGKKILNLFAYTCAFSVVAINAGAASIVNVDMSSRALTLGRENHRLNALNTENVIFLANNILKSWGRITRHGPYDLVIIDPPSFQKGSFVAARDYPKIIRRISNLTMPGADILACLNAPELSESFLTELFAKHCPDCQFISRLPSHVDFPDIDPDKTLKLLHYRNNKC